MPQTLTLHIGLPKTGTTSLQSNLFARHSQLTYAGKPKVHHDPAQLRLLRPIVEHPPEQFDANFERYRQEEVIPFLEAAGDRVLISEEEFSTGTHLIRVHRDVIAERLHRLFPQAQVLMTVRSQLRVLESLYCHLLNVGFMDEIPFGTWIDLEIERPDEEGRLQFLGYDRLLARYRGLFGPDQVHVHIFEHFRRDPDAFIRSLCRLLEIDADEALELQNAHAKLNTRATLRQMRWQAWNRRICVGETSTRRHTRRDVLDRGSDNL